MSTHRIIPTLLLREGGLVKTIRFARASYVGDPINAVKIFNEKEVDELVVLDIEASRRQRPPDFAMAEWLAEECFMPLCWGGGIRTVDDATRLFTLGIEKVSLQTAALADMTLLTEVARRHGTQSVVMSIDIERDWFGRRRVRTARGKDDREWKGLLRQAASALTIGSIFPEFFSLSSRYGLMSDREIEAWAKVEFGAASLGDVRRTARLVAMAASIASRPAGRISEVFRTDAERQGAYDLLESPQVRAADVLGSAVEACAKRTEKYPFVFVPMDGTSISLADRARTKDFGSVGSRDRGARGLKIVDAIAVSPAGVPIGLAAMECWARGPKARRNKGRRKTAEKETQHWLNAIDDVSATFTRRRAHAWIQIDREGDAQDLLERLTESGHSFTVRSRTDRKLHLGGPVRRLSHRISHPRNQFLRSRVARRKPVAFDVLEVPAAAGRPARLACVALRSASVRILLEDKHLARYRALTLNVVWVREHGRGSTTLSRSGKTRSLQLDWMLLTNRPVHTAEQAKLVVFGYTQRWRIEDFHRSWKSGVCNVEDTQLHTRNHVIKWATLLATVALRAERIKHLSREYPESPASDEFSQSEIAALILLKRRYRKRTETISDDMPTLATATRWIAELGGYTGKSSGGPPGTITIARGLEDLRVASEVLLALESKKKKR